MSNNPSVSVRRWIRWENEESEEPTSTLVLTSPNSNFVDVRVLLNLHTERLLKSNPPNHTNEAMKICGKVVEPTNVSQLDWAFAGSSFRTKATDNRPARGVWKHWVDSRHLEAESCIDEGDLFTFHEGGEELELEKGTMAHPRTGKLTPYEELWASSVALSVSEGSDSPRVCVVLRTANEVQGLVTGEQDPPFRGMIIRVGHWAQGIIRRADDLLIERWLWTDDSENDPDPSVFPSSATEAAAAEEEATLKHGGGTWTRLVKLQRLKQSARTLVLPCKFAMVSAVQLVEHQMISTGGISWRVEELFIW